eukprot:TRINITY_DN2965_c1_g1_i1.p1 TRINITY_DN2965_c1_g1~~TRINITY_DN2965_c1_g1_i1.p1  ORF type:complete len:163 (-),score=23.02 TRINITY_DN2965_c1_g1_i1:72-527(-)
MLGGLDSLVDGLYRIVLTRMTTTHVKSVEEQNLAGLCLYMLFHISQEFGDFHDRLPTEITQSSQYADFDRATGICGSGPRGAFSDSSGTLNGIVARVVTVLQNSQGHYSQAKEHVTQIFQKCPQLTVLHAIPFIYSASSLNNEVLILVHNS